MCKRIYLDTNHWIKLLSIEQGKENDELLKKIFIAIKKLTKLDEIRVLFSAFTLHEIWKYHKIEQRNKLIDLVLDISKLWVLKPYDLFFEKEIENAANFVLGKNYLHDIHSEILGRGLGDIYNISFEHMLKRNPIIENAIKNNTQGFSVDFFKNNFQEFNEDLEIVKKNLKSNEFREIHNKSVEDSKKFLKNMEEARHKNSEMSKDLFSRYSQARSIIDSAIPHLAVFMHLRHITSEQLFTPNSKERVKTFNKHLNSLNVLSTLVLERDFSVEKPIISNDVFDMAHLSGAIPYCDVVITDKMFAKICLQKELDKMYDCLILDDLRTLSNVEPIKSKIQRLEVI